MIRIHNTNETSLAAIMAKHQLLDGAGRRVPEERAKVGLAVVIATAAQTEWDHREEGNQDANDRDLEQAEAEPGGKEGRNVGIVCDHRAGEDRPGGIEDEGAVADDRQGRLDPPGPTR